MCAGQVSPGTDRGVGVRPGAPREIGDAGDVRGAAVEICEMQPTRGVVRIGDCRQSSRGVIRDGERVVVCIAYLDQATAAVEGAAQASLVTEGMDTTGAAAEHTKDAGRCSEPAPAGDEGVVDAVVGGPGELSTCTGSQVVTVCMAPAHAQPDIRGVPGVVVTPKLERHGDVRQVNVNIVSQNAATGEINRIAA